MAHTELGTKLYTDELASYMGLPDHEYEMVVTRSANT